MRRHASEGAISARPRARVPSEKYNVIVEMIEENRFTVDRGLEVT
jgi:hypothetical protein